MCLLFTVTKLTKVMLHPWHNYALSLSSCPLDPSSGSEHSEVLYPRVQVYTHYSPTELSNLCHQSSIVSGPRVHGDCEFEGIYSIRNIIDGLPSTEMLYMYTGRSIYDKRTRNERTRNVEVASALKCIRSQDYMYDCKIN